MTLIIFDCDGTLVDSQHGIVAAMDHAFGVLDMPKPERDEVLSIVGLSLPQAFEELAPAADQATRVLLTEAYKSAFADVRRHPSINEPLFPGVRELIAQLAGRRDVTLGLATGKSRRGVDRLFIREGWTSVFATVQTADDHPSKPDPAMVLAAIAETGAPEAETVVVGDTTFDMHMAWAAGVRPIGVGWGYHSADALLAAGASAVAADTAGLLAALALPAESRGAAA